MFVMNQNQQLQLASQHWPERKLYFSKLAFHASSCILVSVSGRTHRHSQCCEKYQALTWVMYVRSIFIYFVCAPYLDGQEEKRKPVNIEKLKSEDWNWSSDMFIIKWMINEYLILRIVCFSKLGMRVLWHDLSDLSKSCHDYRKVAQIYGSVEFSLAAEMATLWIPEGRGHMLLLSVRCEKLKRGGILLRWCHGALYTVRKCSASLWWHSSQRSFWQL